MKEELTYLTQILYALLAYILTSQPISAQIWTRKANLPGGVRMQAVCLSINGKGYFGTGRNSNSSSASGMNDWWEYDTSNNTWTQKANFTGAARYGATGFSINGIGYVGTGYGCIPNVSCNWLNDLYAYNPSNNTWTQKTNFPGSGRSNAVGFSIDTVGYIGLGALYSRAYPTSGYVKDFYAYYPGSNTWVKKADFGGIARQGAMSAVLDNIAYVGTGETGLTTNPTDVWKYNPVTNAWTASTNFPISIYGGTAFVVGGNLYMGYGNNLGYSRNELYRFDTSAKTWTLMGNSIARFFATQMTIGSKAYVMGGEGGANGDMWEFDPSQNTKWVNKNMFTFNARIAATTFTVGDMAYLCAGIDYVNGNNTYLKDLWEFNSLTGTWTQRANLPGVARSAANGCTIGNYGYLGGGNYATNPFSLSDFYRYDPVTNTWSVRASMPNINASAAMFEINNKGYLVGGSYGHGKTWEYNPSLDVWKQVADWKGNGATHLTAFSIGNKGYVGLGGDVTKYTDFWEYDQSGDIWTQKSSFPFIGVSSNAYFTIDRFGYVCAGEDQNRIYSNEVYRYDTDNDTWSVQPALNATQGRVLPFGFAIGNKGYVGNGYLNQRIGQYDLWEYSPFKFSIKRLSTAISCSGDSIFITYSNDIGAPANVLFQLSSSTGSFINPVTLKSAAINSGKDSVRVMLPMGMTASSTYRIRMVSTTDTSNYMILSVGKTTIKLIGPSTFCSGGSVSLYTSDSTPNLKYRWFINGIPTVSVSDTLPIYKATVSGKYSVRISTKFCDFLSADTQITNNGNSMPIPSIAATSVTQCFNFNKFTFKDTSSILSGSYARRWKISTGDTSSADSVIKSFPVPGLYTVQLNITSDKGCEDSVQLKINVIPSPKAGFTLNKPVQCLKANSFSFTDTSLLNGGILSNRTWYFGDNTTASSITTVKTYSMKGSYNAKLVSLLTNGCSDSSTIQVRLLSSPATGFTINNSLQCIYNNLFNFTDTSQIDSGNLTRLWKIGINDTSSMSLVSKVFPAAGTYSIKLISQTANGCKDSLSKNVTVVDKPNSVVTAQGPVQFCEGGNVLIKSNTLTGGTYQWLMNDTLIPGATAVSYTATLQGAYRIIQILTGSCVDSSNAISVTVLPKPKAGFSTNNAVQCLSTNLFVFTDTSKISSGTYNTYWTVGTSDTATSTVLTRSFSMVGNIPVKLMVKTNAGCKDSITRNIIVLAKPIITPISGDVTVQAGTIHSYRIGKSTGMTYHWNLSDGLLLTLENFDTVGVKWSSVPGNGKVSAWMTSTAGCSSDTSKMNVVISSQPFIDSLSLDKDSLRFPYSGNTQILQVSSNKAWHAHSFPNWLHVTPDSATGNMTVSIKVDSNNQNVLRTWSLMFQAGIETRTVVIQQSKLDPSALFEMEPVNEFLLVPNPTSGVVQLINSDENASYTMQVYNSFGQQMGQPIILHSGAFFDVTYLPQGIYIVKLGDVDGASKFLRLVVAEK